MRLPSLLWIFWLIFLKIVPGAKNLKDLLVISPTSIIFVALSHLPSALLIIWLIFKKIVWRSKNEKNLDTLAFSRAKRAKLNKQMAKLRAQKFAFP